MDTTKLQPATPVPPAPPVNGLTHPPEPQKAYVAYLDEDDIAQAMKVCTDNSVPWFDVRDDRATSGAWKIFFPAAYGKAELQNMLGEAATIEEVR